MAWPESFQPWFLIPFSRSRLILVETVAVDVAVTIYPCQVAATLPRIPRKPGVAGLGEMQRRADQIISGSRIIPVIMLNGVLPEIASGLSSR